MWYVSRLHLVKRKRDGKFVKRWIAHESDVENFQHSSRGGFPPKSPSFAESLRFLLQEHVNPRLQICEKRRSKWCDFCSISMDVLRISWESFKVWQIKGDPIHKWRLACWETWRHFWRCIKSAKGKLKPEPARFLWHATDVNTGATSVTKAYQYSVLTVLIMNFDTATPSGVKLEHWYLSKLFRWWFWTHFVFTST